MPRDALTTRTGLILGAATVLLAVSTLGLTIRAQPKIAAAPDYICRLPAAEWSQPPAPDPVVITAQPDPLAALPQECSRYITTIRQFAESSCPGLPEDTRESLLQAVDQMVQAWQTMPHESLQMLEGICREGNHTMRNALTQLCPDPVTQ